MIGCAEKCYLKQHFELNFQNPPKNSRKKQNKIHFPLVFFIGICYPIPALIQRTKMLFKTT